MSERYDAVVVGASLAGCSAATLLARAGAKVALVDRRAKVEDYKRACTHFIQSSATPTIERLGLAERIEAAGGLRNGVSMWTRYGWVEPELDETYPYPRYGYSIRREKLDPMVRELAVDAGAELILGRAATEVSRTNGRVDGVVVEGRDRKRHRMPARVVVGADGRGSTVAKLARVPGRVRPHGRFSYFAYYTDVERPRGNNAMLWMQDPDGGAFFPNDDGVTLIGIMPTKRWLPEVKKDPEAAVLRFHDSFPDAADLREGTRISPWLGAIELPNVARPAARPGIAFVGDAAMACDPLWGVGCGFALQSGEWLADAITEPLLNGGDVDAALDKYRRRHFRNLAGHHWSMCDYANGRKFGVMEKLIFAAGARDRDAAVMMYTVGSRSVPFQHPLNAKLVARSLRVVLGT